MSEIKNIRLRAYHEHLNLSTQEFNFLKKAFKEMRKGLKSESAKDKRIQIRKNFKSSVVDRLGGKTFKAIKEINESIVKSN